MNIEIIKESSKNWNDLRNALNERADNLLIEPTSDQRLLLEKVNNQQRLIQKVEEFQLITEMAAHIRKMWDRNSILKIFFFGGQNERTQKVLSFAAEWSIHCSISFVATNNINESNLRISFTPPFSWSVLGTDAKNISTRDATMNFGWLDNSTEDKEFKRVVLHEFGHVLGLLHEHQSPSITINWKKDFVYNHFRFNYNWDRATVDRNIFEEFEKTNTKFSAVDTESIMGYCIPPEFNYDNIGFPTNFELSEMDKQFIGTIYP